MSVEMNQRPSVLPMRYRIKTPPIVEALSVALTQIEFRSTGAFLVAPQRWGKTSAAHYIIAAITVIHGKIPVLFVPMRKDVKRGAATFFRFLLSQARYKYASSKGRTETDLRNLFTNYVVTRGRRCRHKMFIIVFDEAQLLTIEQWNFVFNISNEADALGVNVFILSVGQPLLLKSEEMLLNNGQEEISERFLQRQIPFRGINSENELKFVFQEVDKTAIRRNSLDLVVSQYCPTEVAGGWRLADEANKFWSSFVLIYAQYRISQVELPMTYIFNAINRFLVAMSKRDGKQWVVPDNLHFTCVQESGIVSSIVSLIRRKEKGKQKNT